MFVTFFMYLFFFLLSLFFAFYSILFSRNTWYDFPPGIFLCHVTFISYATERNVMPFLNSYLSLSLMGFCYRPTKFTTYSWTVWIVQIQNMTVFWDVAPCVPVEVYRRFRLIALMMKAEINSETSVNFYQTTRCNNPEDSHLHTRRRENLKSHIVQFLTAVYNCPDSVVSLCWSDSVTSTIYMRKNLCNTHTHYTTEQRDWVSITPTRYFGGPDF
jgi:hypothetical protein